MPPTIILIRHAEALHNVNQISLSIPDRYHIPDPHLSDLGLKQCAELQAYLRESTPLADKIELIVTSPFRRTLQTTQLGLGWLIERGVPVIPRAEWQENSAKPCDTGSPVADLKMQYPDVDFSGLDPNFPAKTGLYAYTQKAVLERGRIARQWLKARNEKVIAVVSHSAFLRTGVANARFANADYRIFDFKDEDPDSVEIQEWELTAEGPGGMGRSEKGWMTVEEGDFDDAEDELEDRPAK